MKKCINCGARTSGNFCSNCGMEVPDFYEKANRAGAGKNSSKVIIAIVSVIVVMAIAAGIAVCLTAYKQMIENQYADNLDSFLVEVTSGAVEAETQGNLVAAVWYDAIWGNTSEEDTYKYVAGAADFDEALENLYLDEDFQAKSATLNDKRNAAYELMLELQEPPDKYKACYDLALELYSQYSMLIDLVTYPTGSYNSYSEKFEELDTQVAELCGKLNTMIPVVY